MSLKILYIQPFEFFGDIRFLTDSFLRISNYLNSRKSEIEGDFEEEYLDLRVEGLPNYFPEYLGTYRKILKELMIKIYERFPFGIVAISCYTSYTYLNCVEVANMIKHYVNPSCLIVVGGYHPTNLPADFSKKKIPQYFSKKYPKSTTPFDYLIKDEGEIPFFHLIRDLFNGTAKKRGSLKQNPIILGPEIVKNLNELPIIKLDLFKKYKDFLNEKREFYISFNRGCLFRCRFCSSSEDSKMNSYRIVRYRSVGKCLTEIKKIINTNWLSIKKLMIHDPIFFPKKSLRKDFFIGLDKIYSGISKIPFNIFVQDRIELCSEGDLKHYKKLQIYPGYGLETGSPTLLCRIGKFLGKNNNQKNARNYLRQAENFIKMANKIEHPIIFYYMGAIPGSDNETMEENSKFFFEERFSGKSLIEKYKVNLLIQKFGLLPGNTLYEKGEKMLGFKSYFKQWYKLFDKNQTFYSSIIKPSENLTFPETMNYLLDFVRKLYKGQRGLGNDFYILSKYIYQRKFYKKFLNIYKEKVLMKRLKNKIPR